MARQGRESRPERDDPQAEMSDRPEQAVESGEPREVGRSRGKAVGKKSPDAAKPAKRDNEHLESGRHDAAGG